MFSDCKANFSPFNSNSNILLSFEYFIFNSFISLSFLLFSTFLLLLKSLLLVTIFPKKESSKFDDVFNLMNLKKSVKVKSCSLLFSLLVK